jgi:hypothetical protein
MRTRTVLLASLAALLLHAPVSNTEIIADTGAATRIGPFDPGYGIYDRNLFPFGHEFSFMAARFVLDAPAEITEVGVFVRNFWCCSPLDMAFRIDIAQGPANPFDSVFTEVYTGIGTIPLANTESGWATIAPAGLQLAAGDWWIVFRPAPFDQLPPGSFFEPPALPGDVPNPMIEYATYNQSYAGWRHLDPATNWASFAIPIPATFGFRVEGVFAVVPEPGSLWLLGAGLLLWTVARRRRIRA